MNNLHIKSVSLIDYKIFETKFVEFKQGINLLVGKNGAGKSTIIEAIAYSMYDVDIKNVKRKDHLIRIGAKKATIEVNFIGIDDIEYRVVRVIGKQPKHYLYQNGSEFSICDNSKLVIEKIGELTGLIENGKKIFESIIFAGQNKITEIFSSGDTKRVILFNEIFNLGIYRSLHDQYLKTSNDKLEHEVSKQSGALGQITESIEDVEILTSELKEATTNRDDCEKELKEITETRDEKKAFLTKIDQKNEKLQSLKQSLSTENSRLHENGEAIVRTSTSIESAKNSKKIVDENEKSYNDYLALKESLQEIATTIRELESYSNKLNRKKELLNSSQKLKLQLEADKRTIDTEISGMTEQIKQLQLQYDSDKLAVKEEKVTLEALLQEGKDIKKIVDICEPIMKSTVTYNGDIDGLHHKIKFTQDSIKAVDENAVSDVETVIESLLEKQQKRDELHREEAKFSSRIEELKSAEIQLSEGFCPILSENCKNLESSSGGRYFTERLEKLITSKALIEKKLQEFEQINEQLINKKSELSTLQNELANNEKKQNEIKEAELLIDAIKKDILITEMHLSKTLFENGYVGDDIYKLYAEVELKIEAKRNEYKTKKEFYDSNFKRVEEILKHIENRQKELSKKERATVSITAKIEESLKAIELIKGEIEVLAEKSAPLESTKKEKEQIDEQFSSLQEPYNLYMTNSENAKKVDEFGQTLTNLESKTVEIKKSIENFTSQITTLNSELSQIDVVALKSELSNLESTLIEKKKLFNECNTVFITAKNRVETNQQRIEEKAKLEAELNVHLKRVEIAKKFRSMVKNLGVKVSEKYLLSISVDASIKFNEITGRNEKIQWVEGYELLLVNSENNKRNFNQLSGGEQVAVAISVRAALLKQLSSAQFAFFDEPTNNLDTERKELLAQSIDKIMSGLNQVIIVTHDDNFETMAECVIEV